MNAITPFVFENEHMIRTIDRDGEPWFVLADVCRVLELSNPAMAAKPLDEDEKAKLNLGFGARGSDATIISESGLYALILRCRGAMTPGTLPHRFRRWVTHEVLPTLRKTGRYDMGGPTSPDAMAADMLPRVSIVREYRMLRGKAAAYALWQRLDLPEAHAPVMADMPDAHAHDLEHYGIPDFLAECTEVHAPSRVQSAVLYAAYKAWHAGREDVALASSTRFGRLLGAAGLNKVTQGCVYYTGLRLVANHTAMTGAA